MSEINTSLLARLLNYGKVEENTTLAPPKAAGADTIGSFTFKGRADMPDRITNNMGDNPMVDDTAEEVDERADMGSIISNDVLDKVHGILNNIGISDSDIAVGNVRLKSAQACMKLVKQATGQAVDESQAIDMCAKIVDQLSMKLSEDLTSDGDEEELNEFFDMPTDSRFTFTTDALGNIQINDTQEGTSVMLRGTDATDFLYKLETEGNTPEDQQKVMAYYQHVMESGEQSIDEDVAVNNFFGASQQSVDALSSLNADLTAMKTKIQSMYNQAMKDGDVEGKVAAQHFNGLINDFKSSLTEYISKLSD
jgi:hypothetical protein